jgi:hypothetical protein
VAINQAVPATALDAPAASVVEGGEAIQLSPEVSPPPATSEPVIELAAEYLEAEPGTTPTEPNLA